MATLAPPPPSTRIACPAPGIYPGVPPRSTTPGTRLPTPRWPAPPQPCALPRGSRPAPGADAGAGARRRPAPVRAGAGTLRLQLHRRGAVRRDGEERCQRGPALHERREGLPGRRVALWQHDKGESEETRRVLSPQEFSVCIGMRDSVRSHPAARDLLDSADAFELSIVFYWPGTEILCKARIDIAAFEAGVIGDLKTTTDASLRGFERSVFNYGYHRQAPFLPGRLRRGWPSHRPLRVHPRRGHPAVRLRRLSPDGRRGRGWPPTARGQAAPAVGALPHRGRMARIPHPRTGHRPSRVRVGPTLRR
jgi:hypothetical protein